MQALHRRRQRLAKGLSYNREAERGSQMEHIPTVIAGNALARGVGWNDQWRSVDGRSRGRFVGDRRGGMAGASVAGGSSRQLPASRLAKSVARDVAGTMEQFDLTLRTVMEGDDTPASRTLTPERRSALLFERTPRARDIAFIDVLGADGSVLATLTPWRFDQQLGQAGLFCRPARQPRDGSLCGSALLNRA